MGHGGNNGCGLNELLIFIAAIIAGTGSSITSKVLLDLQSVGLSGEVEKFKFPLFQTWGMFMGMTVGLIMHYAVLYFKVPFPGYTHAPPGGYKMVQQEDGTMKSSAPPELPLDMYFYLIIPSIFDLFATALCMFGLEYVNVSIYQMLRGSGIVFVAILKQYVLGDMLKKFMWIGVFWNVVSVILVGATAMLAASDSDSESENSPLLGVILICAGAFVQSLQFVFEEKVMTMDVPAPPLLLIGMEGLWGTLICTLVLYPIAYYTPGEDHGSYENPFNTWEMIKNSGVIQFVFITYFLSVFLYNFFAVLVTLMLNSVWHAILDNFRPITVWGVDMFIFYTITAALGEPWTKWSILQLGGMFVLFYGTAIYNGPNPGSLLLQGQWWAFGIDLTDEYREVQDEIEEAQLNSDKPMPSPYMHTMSPFISTPGGSRLRATPRGTRPLKPHQSYGAVDSKGGRARGGSIA